MFRASTDFESLVEASEQTLKQLNFEFIQNRTKDLVELEITSPNYFRIVIARRSDPEVHNFLIPSIKPPKGATMDVYFALDESREKASLAEVDAKTFINALIGALPTKPWEGLRFREARGEEKRWRSFLE